MTSDKSVFRKCLVETKTLFGKLVGFKGTVFECLKAILVHSEKRSSTLTGHAQTQARCSFLAKRRTRSVPVLTITYRGWLNWQNKNRFILKLWLVGSWLAGCYLIKFPFQRLNKTTPKRKVCTFR